MNPSDFCQSCAMPLQPTVLGTNQDGSKNEEYCEYCFQNGEFTSDMTMEEMIDFCVPHMVNNNPDMTAEKAKANMENFFPMLKRWQQK